MEWMEKPKRKRKDDAMIIHFANRLFGRYHIRIQDCVVRQLSNKIKRKDRAFPFTHKYKMTNSRIAGIITLYGIEVAVVYNCGKHLLCTALPPEIVDVLKRGEYSEIKYKNSKQIVIDEQFYTTVPKKARPRGVLIKYKKD